jgi:two-component system nitrogen regulation response regulator GlnG
VRQLENLCRRLAVMAPGREIAAGDIALGSVPESTDRDWTAALGRWARAALDAGRQGLYDEARARFDRALLDAALAVTEGHRQHAAERLGVGRNTITRKLGSSRRRRRAEDRS